VNQHERQLIQQAHDEAGAEAGAVHDRLQKHYEQALEHIHILSRAIGDENVTARERRDLVVEAKDALPAQGFQGSLERLRNLDRRLGMGEVILHRDDPGVPLDY
jgi:hypothetical protein